MFIFINFILSHGFNWVQQSPRCKNIYKHCNINNIINIINICNIINIRVLEEQKVDFILTFFNL